MPVTVITQTQDSTLSTVTIVIVGDNGTATHTLVLDRKMRHIWQGMLQDIRTGHHTVTSSGILAFCV